MRWSIGRFSSPRQYAPATLVSLNGGTSPVRSTCGPSQRSRNAPCLYSEDLLVRDALDQLDLERLAGELLQRLRLRHLAVLEAIGPRRCVAHALLDRRAGLRSSAGAAARSRSRSRCRSAGRWRTSAREHLEHGLRHDVRGRVAHAVQAVFFGHLIGCLRHVRGPLCACSRGFPAPRCLQRKRPPVEGREVSLTWFHPRLVSPARLKPGLRDQPFVRLVTVPTGAGYCERFAGSAPRWCRDRCGREPLSTLAPSLWPVVPRRVLFVAAAERPKPPDFSLTDDTTVR